MSPDEPLRKAYRIARICGLEVWSRVAPLLGRRSLYELPAGYRHRRQVSYYDDTANEDEWQREVYEAARDLMRERHLRTVTDVGCGSGYKLVEILGEYETTGLDLPQTIERVRRTYPDRNWIAGSFENARVPKADLVICSDVIEHVADPDALMRFLVGLSNDTIVISTPDRDLFYSWRSRNRFGPPSNPAHLREWTMAEFGRYVGRFLAIERHEITNREQGTQMIVGRARA